MKKRLYLFLILVFSVQILWAQQPMSMKSTGSGFSGSFHIGFMGWSSDDFLGDIGSEAGFDVGIDLGYGISELFQIFGGLDYASVSTDVEGLSSYPFWHYDLGVRLNFGSTTKPIRPYVDASFSFITNDQEIWLDNFTIGDLTMKGYGLSLGGGIKYHLSLPVALKVGAKFSFSTFDDLSLDGQIINEEYAMTSFRIFGGLVYYF